MKRTSAKASVIMQFVWGIAGQSGLGLASQRGSIDIENCKYYLILDTKGHTTCVAKEMGRHVTITLCRGVCVVKGILYPVTYVGGSDPSDYGAPGVPICIPNSAQVLAPNYARNRTGSDIGFHLNCSIVTFEVGSPLAIICKGTFYHCRNLQQICVPGSVQRLEERCFCGCVYLCSAIFEPNSRLERIDSDAFADCTSLTTISIPSRVQTINERCFSYCKNLLTVIFEQASCLATIGESAFFKCSSLTAICIPYSVHTIGTNCFRGCNSLTTVTLPPGSQLL